MEYWVSKWKIGCQNEKLLSKLKTGGQNAHFRCQGKRSFFFTTVNNRHLQPGHKMLCCNFRMLKTLLAVIKLRHKQLPLSWLLFRRGGSFVRQLYLTMSASKLKQQLINCIFAKTEDSPILYYNHKALSPINFLWVHGQREKKVHKPFYYTEHPQSSVVAYGDFHLIISNHKSLSHCTKPLKVAEVL